MKSHDDILRILENGESRHTEFKRRLTKADLKKERKEKLITRIKYMTCENPFEGLFLVAIEDIAGKEWEVRGISESALKTSESVLIELCEEAAVEIVEEEREVAAEKPEEAEKAEAAPTEVQARSAPAETAPSEAEAEAATPVDEQPGAAEAEKEDREGSEEETEPEEEA